jgi:stage II sporulation protein D
MGTALIPFTKCGRAVALVACTLCAMRCSAEILDGGGKDVTIALFTTHHVNAVILSSAGPEAWLAVCTTCAHKPLTSAMRIEKPGDIFAAGSIRVVDAASGEARTTTGLWHLRKQNAADSFDVVLTVPSEKYIEAVLSAETASDEPAQSLEAMAIVARTYALNGVHYTSPSGHLKADLCDSTQCQALRFGNVSSKIANAVRNTAGETLWFRQQRAEVFFSQDCGGMTEDAATVWPALGVKPYLISHADMYCVRRDPARWHAEISLADLKNIATTEGWELPAHITAARVTKRSVSHRALQILFTGAQGESAVVAATALRFGVGRELGWNKVRSDAYDIFLRGDALIFDGRGHGHGVGLCQVGAAEMGAEGKSALDILQFYFPGTDVHVELHDDGWLKTQVGRLSVRSTHVPSEQTRAAIQQAWEEAKKRFGKETAVIPEVVLAPSTELFRQLAVQPGWALASSRGQEIVLQPEAVFSANKVNWPLTLRHEMLHVLVESEASAQTPLWFREGFVEVLNGDFEPSAGAMSPAEIDRALTSAVSWRQAALAHREAASMMRRLITRYGTSAVSGWLVSGVPSGVAF